MSKKIRFPGGASGEQQFDWLGVMNPMVDPVPPELQQGIADLKRVDFYSLDEVAKSRGSTVLGVPFPISMGAEPTLQPFVIVYWGWFLRGGKWSYGGLYAGGAEQLEIAKTLYTGIQKHKHVRVAIERFQAVGAVRHGTMDNPDFLQYAYGAVKPGYEAVPSRKPNGASAARLHSELMPLLVRMVMKQMHPVPQDLPAIPLVLKGGFVLREEDSGLARPLTWLVAEGADRITKSVNLLIDGEQAPLVEALKAQTNGVKREVWPSWAYCPNIVGTDRDQYWMVPPDAILRTAA